MSVVKAVLDDESVAPHDSDGSPTHISTASSEFICVRFRILLKSSGSGIQELCAQLHLETPEGLLPRKIWTTPQLRQLYEPALVRALLLYEMASDGLGLL